MFLWGANGYAARLTGPRVFLRVRSGSVTPGFRFPRKPDVKNINCCVPANFRYLEEFVWLFPSEAAFSGSLNLEGCEEEDDIWGEATRIGRRKPEGWGMKMGAGSWARKQNGEGLVFFV